MQIISPFVGFAWRGMVAWKHKSVDFFHTFVFQRVKNRSFSFRVFDY